MRKIFTFLTLSVCASIVAQIKYEKGYYIANDGQKTVAMIRNIDWKNNPTIVELRTGENAKPITLGISEVKEFGLDGGVKFVRETVDIDKSSETISSLTLSAAPKFENETLFLKPMTEGRANLYYYEQGNLKRYFYNVDNGPVTQLIYKTYLLQNDKKGDVVAVNNEFRTQIINSLKCGSISERQTQNLQYRNNSLREIFTYYNNCIEGNNQQPAEITNTRKGDFNISLRPRVNFTSLSVSNAYSSYRDTDFGSKTTIGGGVEFEYVFPFNKGKWSFIAEPTYQYYESEKVQIFYEGTGYESRIRNWVEYKSIELPLGLRHYMFLNDKNKVFVNASYVIDMPLESGIFLSNSTELSIKSSFPVAFGAGYKYNDRFSAEFRYITPRNVLANYALWISKYPTASFILGYQIF